MWDGTHNPPSAMDGSKMEKSYENYKPNNAEKLSR